MLAHSFTATYARNQTKLLVRVFRLCPRDPAHRTYYFQCCQVVKEKLGSLGPPFPSFISTAPTFLRFQMQLGHLLKKRRHTAERLLLRYALYARREMAPNFMKTVQCLPHDLHGKRNRSE